jgi:hypothetical protein
LKMNKTAHHLKHSLAPKVSEYVPGAHGVQAVLPSVGANVPGGLCCVVVVCVYREGAAKS